MSTPPGVEHLYIHVPFCRRKCSYCDFYSVAMPDDTAMRMAQGYGRWLLDEIDSWTEEGAVAALSTVYVGGGTPSLIAAEVADVLGGLAHSGLVAADAEITIEANPESIDDSVASVLTAAAAKLRRPRLRLSLGVQSFDDEVLATLGRPHDAKGARRAARSAREAGFELSVDLMCGVPGQTEESWIETLSGALATGAHHISVYPLSIEDGTAMAVEVASGSLPDPDPDEAANQMVIAQELLAEAGLQRYEVANYAYPGNESLHNSAYWTGAPYLGVGPGAHGMLTAAQAAAAALHAPEGAARLRYAYSCTPAGAQHTRELETEWLSAAEARREDAMLGLRRRDGISDELAADAEVTDVLADLAEVGLVEHAEERWRTTARGWLLGNEVFSRVWAGE